MRNLSLGVSNNDFAKIVSTTTDRFKGLILLKPEDLGKAYYVNPTDKSIACIADPTDAFYIMRKFLLNISSENLKTIPIAKIVLNNSGIQISREWQNLGWWGRVNAIAQPAPDKVLVIPPKVEVGDYWTDLNLSKKVLTLYKYDQPVLSIYVSTGMQLTPTVLGCKCHQFSITFTL